MCAEHRDTPLPAGHAGSLPPGWDVHVVDLLPPPSPPRHDRSCHPRKRSLCHSAASMHACHPPAEAAATRVTTGSTPTKFKVLLPGAECSSRCLGLIFSRSLTMCRLRVHDLCAMVQVRQTASGRTHCPSLVLVMSPGGTAQYRMALCKI